MTVTKRHIPSNWLVAFLFYLTVVGCSPVAVEDRHDLSLRMPERFSAATPGQNAKNVSWEKSFPSKRLKMDIEQLHEQNYEIEAARHRLEQAALAYAYSAAELMPSINAHAGFERSRDETRMGTDSSTTENAVIISGMLSWEADVW
ncbi:MAG: TolC family protein, partial [Desulfopila sp.]|nr:TolC family protein [Desulfopila sp.]